MATSTWDDPSLTGALGNRIADDLRNLVRAYSTGDERSQQTHLGPSQIGNPCTRCLARHTLGMSVVREFDDPWCRVLGTAGHAWLEEAAVWDNIHTVRDAARWETEKRVHPHPDLLPAGGKTDLYDRHSGTVIDHKIVGPAPLKKYKLSGPGAQYRAQAHLYGLGYSRTGAKVNNVAVAFWCRGGRLSDLHVWTEPYDANHAIAVLERYRTIRDQALAIGPAILPLLPANSACWDCGGKDVSAEELAVINNPAQTIVA